MFFSAAILMGLASSLHCMGMCGPLLSVLPWYNSGAFSFKPALLHHGGRIFSYVVLGVLAGVVGESFAFLGFQQWLSVFAGVVILLAIIFKNKLTGKLEFFLKPIQKISSQKGLNRNTKLFAIGVLNGLLPCGMVYMAMAGSIAGGSIIQSMGFMALFGLGTLPALFGFSMIQTWIGSKWKSLWNRFTYVLLIAMAVIFILRGLNMGIPYVSPKLAPETGEVKCH